jgi:hypothetical protein
MSEINQILLELKITGSEDAKTQIGNLEKGVAALRKEYKLMSNDIDGNSAAMGKNSTQVKALEQEKNRLLKTTVGTIQSQEAEEGSLTQLRIALSKATAEYNRMGEVKRNSVKGKELETSIINQTQAISALEQKMGNFRRNVGNYASGWNGLSNSINQVTRELPNFAQSATIGFMALSNNLPILAEEINRVRIANAALAKDGEKTTSVFKQIATSLFSWQSVLITAISLSIIYAKEITNLFNNTKELDKATKDLSETIGRDIAQTKMLVGIIDNTNISMDKRIVAAKELIKLYPKTLENYSAEEIAAGKASAAIDKITNSVISYAKIKAIQNDIDKIAANQWASEKQLKDAQLEYRRRENEAERLSAEAKLITGKGQEAAIERTNRANRALQEQREEIAKLVNTISSSDKKMKQLSVSASDLLPNILDEKIDTTKGTKAKAVKTEKIKAEEDYQKELLALVEQYHEQNLELIDDKYILAYAKELEQHHRIKDALKIDADDTVEIRNQKNLNLEREEIRHQKAMAEINPEAVKTGKIDLVKPTGTFSPDISKELKDKEDADKKIKDQEDANRKLAIDAAITAAKQTVDAISQIKQDALDRNLQRELTAIQRNADGQDRILENRLRNGIISESQYADEKIRLNEATAAAELEADRKAFEEKKKLDTTMAVINTALAITSILAYSKDATGVQTAIRIGTAIAAGIASVAVIQAQKFALGGKVNGKSHAQGGVMIEAEGGEGMINKNSMRSTQVMQAIGTPSQIASAINTTGGGVSWEQGATLRPNPNMFSNSSSSQGVTYSQMASLIHDLKQGINDKKVILLESDVTKTQNKVKAYESASRF